MAYATISSEPKVLLEIEESYAITKGFPTLSTTLKAGQVVKLNNDGTVSPIAATTDKPFGVVVSAYMKIDTGNVRVYTPFVVIFSNATADGTLAPADLVASSGVDANGLPKFKKAVTGDFVCGQCLVGNTTGLGVKIGYYRVPSLAASL